MTGGAAFEPGLLAQLGELALDIPRDYASAATAPVADPDDRRPVLVTGVARSGSTWVARTLTEAADASYLHEPDNPAHGAFAHGAKRGLSRYPRLAVGERSPLLERCFDAAFVGWQRNSPWRREESRRLFQLVPPADRERSLDPSDGTRTPTLVAAHRLAEPRWTLRHRPMRVVKSVHLALCLEWLAQRWDTRILVVRRHPMASVASWLELGVGNFLHDDDRHVVAVAPDVVERIGVAPLVDAAPVERIAWMVGFLASALDEAAAAVGAEVADHEVLCRDPVGEFRWVCRRMGIGWTDAADDYLVGSNQEGQGEKLQRIAAEQPGRWKERFTDDDRDRALAVLSRFPVASRYPELR